MELSNEFEVHVPVDEVWALAVDPERLAGCVPGARFEAWQADECCGRIDVKLGPLAAHYVGGIRIVEQDPDQRWLLLSAAAHEVKGGVATLTVSAQLSAVDAERTHVSLVADLAVTGKIAQFGRALLVDANDDLVPRLASRIERAFRPDQASQPVLGRRKVDPLATLPDVRLSDLVFGEEPEVGWRRSSRGHERWQRAAGAALAALLAGAVGARVLRAK